MPSLKQKKEVENKIETRPAIQRIKKDIDLTPYTIPEGYSTGYAMAVAAKSKSGKSDTGIVFGYLDLKYKDLLKRAGYDLIVDALEKGVIPPIKRIFLIETEGGWKSQSAKPYERRLFGEIVDDQKIIHWPINKVKLKKIIKNNKEVDLSEEDIEDVQIASNTLFAYISTLQEIVEPTDLVIIDSGSKMKRIFDLDTLIWEEFTSKGITDPKRLRDIGIKRYGDRNTYWEYVMETLRDFPCWTWVTFKVKRHKEWVLNAFDVDPNQPVWLENTEYFFDQMYRIKFALDPKLRSYIEPDQCRYVSGDKEDDRVNIKANLENDDVDRVQTLGVIENLLKNLKGNSPIWIGYEDES